MFNKIQRVVGITLLTMVGAFSVAGLETAYAFVPPPIGTATIIPLVGCTAYAYRVYLHRSYRRAVTHRRAAGGLVVSAALCVAVFDALQHRWVPAQPIPFINEASVGPWGIASNYLVALVLAPLLEEALLRGFMLSRLVTIARAPAAIIISAGTFAIVHLDATRVPGRFLAGILLAAIVVVTSRLWLAVLAHALMNAGSILEDGAVYAGLPDAMGFLYVMMCAIIAVLAAWEFRRILRATAWTSTSSRYRSVSRPVTWDAEPLL